MAERYNALHVNCPNIEAYPGFKVSLREYGDDLENKLPFCAYKRNLFRLISDNIDSLHVLSR